MKAIIWNIYWRSYYLELGLLLHSIWTSLWSFTDLKMTLLSTICNILEQFFVPNFAIIEIFLFLTQQLTHAVIFICLPWSFYCEHFPCVYSMPLLCLLWMSCRLFVQNYKTSFEGQVGKTVSRTLEQRRELKLAEAWWPGKLLT